MITINCFSPTFSRMPCSVAFQKSKYVQYVWERMDWSGITFFTDGLINDDRLVGMVNSPIKIGWLREPNCLYPEVYEASLNHVDNFAFVMTYDNDLIGSYSGKYRYVPYGGVWIDRKEWGIKPKTKNLSMLFGEKMATNGHRLRHEIYEHIGYRYGIEYYGKYGTPTNYSAETKLMVHQDYRFSIVTETCREDGLFTEILLDCFAAGTIPIFWGAPDIDKYFDGRGIYSFQDVGDLEHLLKTIAFDGEDIYNERLPYIENNLKMVDEYAVTEDWLFNAYIKHLPTVAR